MKNTTSSFLISNAGSLFLNNGLRCWRLNLFRHAISRRGLKLPGCRLVIQAFLLRQDYRRVGTRILPSIHIQGSHPPAVPNPFHYARRVGRFGQGLELFPGVRGILEECAEPTLYDGRFYPNVGRERFQVIRSDFVYLIFFAETHR